MRKIRPDPTPEELARMPANLRHYYKVREKIAKQKAEYVKEYMIRVMSDPVLAARKREQARTLTRKYREADPEKARETTMKSWTKWAKANPEKRAENSRVSRHRATAKKLFLVSLFRANGCACCPEKDPVSMEAHHFDPLTKDMCIGSRIHSTSSPKLISDELAKCVCVCANCHAKIHAGKIECPRPVYDSAAGMAELERRHTDLTIALSD